MNYAKRRCLLRERLGENAGILFFPGNELQSRNYPHNVYMPFRQNSHFAYYTGITAPGFALLLFPDGREVLFGPPWDLDEVVWTGPQRRLEEWAGDAEVQEARPFAELADVLKKHRAELHYLPPFSGDVLVRMEGWLGGTASEIQANASTSLVEAVVAQRLKKSEEELASLEDALQLTREIFHHVMQLPLVGMREAEVLGQIQQRVAAAQRDLSFPPIVTVRGEVLHNHEYNNILEEGQLLLMDMGTESVLGYAADITRTFPANGRYSPKQKAIYEIVLAAQMAAIEAIQPGRSFRDIHRVACHVLAEGLVELGLMRGNPEDAVSAGAHALFFPHGLGHMLGGDVHDMEDLGDIVGYGGEGRRSTQFGLNFLRMGRELEEGHVVTIEPGIYLIPPLISIWGDEKRHNDFLCYEKLQDWLDFGGIRIEDDVCVTSTGGRVLGEPIVKQVEEVESLMGASS